MFNTLNLNPFEEDKAPRYHYDGYRIEDGGKTIRIGVVTPDEQIGKLVIPWEEIQEIHKLAWENQKREAEEKMKGKRVHCRHLWTINHWFSPCCQIGKNNGPHDVNCLTCKYIDGYIEEYDPDKEIEYVTCDLSEDDKGNQTEREVQK